MLTTDGKYISFKLPCYDFTSVSDFNTHNSEKQQDKQFKVFDIQVTVHHDKFL